MTVATTGVLSSPLNTFKIWERVLNYRFVELVSISDNQCGFMPGKFTTDAIQTLRNSYEETQGKQGRITSGVHRRRKGL